MSLRLPSAAVRAYDHLKNRPGAPRRRSDARDPAALAAVTRRLEELVGAYRIGGQVERGATYVFWTEVENQIGLGEFDDLLDLL